MSSGAGPRWWERPAVARFRRKKSAMVGAWIILSLIIFAALGPLIVRHPPNASDFQYGIDGASGLPVGPTDMHWLGTDALFRDELARLAQGARLSLTIAIFATVISSGIGALVGTVAGYFAGTKRGFVDVLLMRFVDVLLSFPYLLLVMAIAAALDRTSPFTVLMVLGLTSWLGTARLLRAKTMQIRELGFVEASRALGQSTPRLLMSHILPNVMGPLIVVSTISMSTMILAESVLSYLQVGIQPPTATWGRMLYEGQHHFTLEPRLVFAPGVAILTSVLGFHLVGEGLREAFDAHDAR